MTDNRVHTLAAVLPCTWFTNLCCNRHAENRLSITTFYLPHPGTGLAALIRLLIVNRTYTMVYGARRFGDNVLHKILNGHWRDFIGARKEHFQRTCGGLLGVAQLVVSRFLDCGNPANVLASIKCWNCGAEKLLHLSCKTCCSVRGAAALC